MKEMITILEWEIITICEELKDNEKENKNYLKKYLV